MSDPIEPGSPVAILGAGAVGAFLLKIFEGLFKRSVNTEDEARKEMRADIKELIGQVASQRDDITKLTAELSGFKDRLIITEAEAKAAHRRLDDGARAKP